MMYIKLNKNIITGIYCGNKPKGTIDVPDSFCGLVGQSIKEFDDEYNLRPLSSRVEEGLVEVPSGYKLDGEAIIPMTDIEQYKAGMKEVPRGMILDGGNLRSATLEEQVAKGELTQDEADAMERQGEIATLSDYLASTDWYATRWSETGKGIPEDIAGKRQAARDRISELKG